MYQYHVSIQKNRISLTHVCPYHLVDGFGPGHPWQPNIMFALPPANVNLLPVDLNLERVVLDLRCRLGLANLIRQTPILRWLPHLDEQHSADDTDRNNI